MAKITEKNIDEFVEKLIRKYTKEYDGFGYIETKKYYKVVRINCWENPSSVYCFVDKENGDIYKANGWKAPEKTHIRGNILTDISKCEEFGIAYLK